MQTFSVGDHVHLAHVNCGGTGVFGTVLRFLDGGRSVEIQSDFGGCVHSAGPAQPTGSAEVGLPAGESSRPRWKPGPPSLFGPRTFYGPTSRLTKLT